MNYLINVIWDVNVRDLWFLDTQGPMPDALKGLAYEGKYVVTGAPAATAGKWAPSAKVYNLVDATWYIMDGTTASPTWSLIDTGTGDQAGIQFEDENGDPLGTSGTVDEFEITGPSVTAVRVGDKVTYTISAEAGPTPSPYSLGVANGYNTLAGTTLTLTAPQLFTTGNIGQTTLVGTPSFGTGSNLGTTGLVAAKAAVLALYTTLKALLGTAITTPSAFEGDNYGYGVGVFVPGVYTTASAIGGTASGEITLSGDGDYVFVSTGGAIVFGATFIINLTNGAKASRVFFVANNAITMGANDNLKGNFMSGAAGAITVGSTVSVEGRLLSPVAVTIDGTATNLYLPLA